MLLIGPNFCYLAWVLDCIAFFLISPLLSTSSVIGSAPGSVYILLSTDAIFQSLSGRKSPNVKPPQPLSFPCLLNNPLPSESINKEVLCSVLRTFDDFPVLFFIGMLRVVISLPLASDLAPSINLWPVLPLFLPPMFFARANYSSKCLQSILLPEELRDPFSRPY